MPVLTNYCYCLAHCNSAAIEANRKESFDKLTDFARSDSPDGCELQCAIKEYLDAFPGSSSLNDKDSLGQTLLMIARKKGDRKFIYSLENWGQTVAIIERWAAEATPVSKVKSI